MALSTEGVRQAWGPACHITAARVVLFGGAPITVDHRTVAAWGALSGCLERHNYPARQFNDKGEPVTGAYNCRAITGGTGFSLHSYGVAADLNWDRNPYGPRLVTDMPPAMVAEIISLRTNSGAQVFRWGGMYSGNKDAMHYEIVCTPAELATGIRPVSGGLPVPPPTIPVTAPQEDDDVANPNSHKSADGRVELFYISPVGDLYHAYQDPVAGAALGPLVPFGQPEGVKLDPALGVRIEQNTDGRLEIFCGKLDPAGGVLQSNQMVPSGAWTPLVQLP